MATARFRIPRLTCSPASWASSFARRERSLATPFASCGIPLPAIRNDQRERLDDGRPPARVRLDDFLAGDVRAELFALPPRRVPFFAPPPARRARGFAPGRAL